jgi:hypothetical protein
MPMSWKEALGGEDYVWPGCKGWQAEYPVAVWLYLSPSEDGTSGSLSVKAEVGPVASYECRSAIIERIKKIASEQDLVSFKFQADAAAEGRRYSRFLRRNSVQIHDLSDASEIAAAIRKALMPFHADFSALTPALDGLTKFAEPA